MSLDSMDTAKALAYLVTRCPTDVSTLYRETDDPPHLFDEKTYARRLIDTGTIRKGIDGRLRATPPGIKLYTYAAQVAERTRRLGFPDTQD